jgi:hypothetical protein
MTPIELTPESRRQLVAQLSSARRAVGAARLAGNPGAEAEAHARVHTVKVALGGDHGSWWDDMS